jgi:hypothetical protein
MGWDGMGWDGMGWDGMGWDGMGWDGMGWDGTRNRSACRASRPCAGTRCTLPPPWRRALVQARPCSSHSQAPTPAPPAPRPGHRRQPDARRAGGGGGGRRARVHLLCGWLSCAGAGRACVAGLSVVGEGWGRALPALPLPSLPLQSTCTRLARRKPAQLPQPRPAHPAGSAPPPPSAGWLVPGRHALQPPLGALPGRRLLRAQGAWQGLEAGRAR